MAAGLDADGVTGETVLSRGMKGEGFISAFRRDMIRDFGEGNTLFTSYVAPGAADVLISLGIEVRGTKKHV